MDISGIVSAVVAVVAGLGWLIRLESRITGAGTVNEDIKRRLDVVEDSNKELTQHFNRIETQLAVITTEVQNTDDKVVATFDLIKELGEKLDRDFVRK